MPAARRVGVFTRQEFIDSGRWAYSPGQHVSVLGPTGWGKTYLLQGLLERTAHPGLPGVALVMKPRDKTVSEWAKTAGWRTIRSWPPPWVPWANAKPPGWVVWPRHQYDPEKDDPAHYKIFRRAILDSYKKGNRIVFADEVYGLAAELGLGRECVTMWTRGRSMGAGMWAATQKPTHVPTWMYGQAHHLFLGNDPDERSRDRYKEIGGIDPKLLKSVVSELEPWHWLYIRRAGPRMCVIAP